MASKLKAHALMPYYAQFHVQQWKCDKHNPFLWKHHPQLKLPTNHLHMVEVIVLTIHYPVGKKKKLEQQFKVYLPKETPALFLFC